MNEILLCSFQFRKQNNISPKRTWIPSNFGMLSTLALWTPRYYGHPAIRTAAKSPGKINYRRLTERNSRYYGLSLLRTSRPGLSDVSCSTRRSCVCVCVCVCVFFFSQERVMQRNIGENFCRELRRFFQRFLCPWILSKWMSNTSGKSYIWTAGETDLIEDTPSLSQRHTWRFYAPIAANLIAGENRKQFSPPLEADRPGDLFHRSRRCGTSTLFIW